MNTFRISSKFLSEEHTNRYGKERWNHNTFDNIASDYDKLNHILSLNIDRGWRKKAVREIVDTEKPIKVLDVACGTADFTIEIAQKTSF